MTHPTDLEAAARRILELAREATPGEWTAKAQGGSSTVLACTKPPRNDTRIPPYGYREDLGHCIAYPFLEDDGRARWDFVCFSHDDARLIAFARNHAPALAAEYLRLRDVEKAARELFLTSQNEMVSRGLPLEWQDDCIALWVECSAPSPPSTSTGRRREMTEPCHVCGAKDHEPYCSVEPSWRGRIAALEAENARLRKLEALTKEGRHAFNDQNEAGKTIVDFLNCWLDQEKARAEIAERQLAEAREALEMAARRFEMLAVGGVKMTNGACPRVGAQEARAALAPAEKPGSDGEER